MPLRLITGPPNSGRTGAILRGFRAALGREPVLVVPTFDDVERFEAELVGAAARGGDPRAIVGASIGTFERLFSLVSSAVGHAGRPALTPAQRLRVAREAADRARLRLLAASAERPGFAAALEEFVGELGAAAIDPRDLERRAADAGPYEAELARLYRGFNEVRDEVGRDDDHTRAADTAAALRRRPDAWTRPIFLYGFDDLTEEQLELVRVLSSSSEVTVALTYEDRDALAARARLPARLRELGPASIEALEADPTNTESETLFALERRFSEPGAEPVGNDGGLRTLVCAGELAEIEAIGAEVARLLHDGVDPGGIAIVLRDPAAAGPLFTRVLGRFEIPVAVQADLPLARTATGAGLAALLRASVGAAEAGDLLAYLRSPGVAHPETVDWLERRIRRRRLRSADEAIEAWREGSGRELEEIGRLREAGSGVELLREAGRQARWIAEAPVRRRAAIPGADRALELRAGAEVEAALAELAELGLPMDAGSVDEALAALRVPLWRGPTADRVRVISPYRARARRVSHLFIASLQHGEFPRFDAAGPLLSDDARRALALPPRIEAEREDRYLFAICLSRPTQRLWLCWRDADEEGAAASRSPFVDEVRELLEPPPPLDPAERDELLAAESGGRGLADATFSPGAAPSEDELARALAADRLGADAVAVPAQIAARLSRRLAAVPALLADERLQPGPLRLPAVVEAMRANDLFGPSTLEQYATCPYIWFVRHELDPQRLDPDDEIPTAGQIAHEVLEAVYAQRPGDSARPTPETLPTWIDRARELTASLGTERLPRERAETAAALRRVEGLVLAFLSDEAGSATAFETDPALAEASFGFPGSEKEPLRIDGGAIRGRIDRVDIGPGGAALIQDYKTGARVDGGARMHERGKLQLQLYLLAARTLWGLDLAGGLYRPLGGASERRPKGVVRAEYGADLEPLDPRPGDLLSEEAFEEALGAAERRAVEIVSAIRSGRVARDPIGGSCPDWCRLQSICRRERGLPEEETAEEPEEEPA